MYNNDISILSELSQVSSPSSCEGNMRNYLISKCAKLVDSYTSDSIGNLFLKKDCNCNDVKNVMIVAHMDEIGIIITHIEENGLIRFDKIGGINESVLIGSKVKIETKDGYIFGVIGSLPPHIKQERNQKIEVWDLWIDIGATNKEDAQQHIGVGDTGVIFGSFNELINDNISMRAADNRTGLAIIIYLLEALRNYSLNRTNLTCVASVQEEIGLRGSTALCMDYSPDYIIVLDVTHATDYPGIKKSIYGDIKLGHGPVIPISPDSSKDLQFFIQKTAIQNNISYQVQAFARPTSTDLNAINMRFKQAQTGLICVPCRYMHSPCEIISITDIKNTVSILLNFILQLNGKKNS